MSPNKYVPHVYVLPEDDANSQMVNGFLLWPTLNHRVIRVMHPCGGWSKVIDAFIENHVADMRSYPERRLVLIVDFDDVADRFDSVKDTIPPDLLDRVFVIGVQDNPETLRQCIAMSFETIGKELARDCAHNTNVLWGHPQLNHNSTELHRMIRNIKPFLFSM
jgi:hypothetical protein